MSSLTKKPRLAPTGGDMPPSVLWNKGFILITLISCLVNFANYIVGNAFSYWIIDIGGTASTYGLIHGLYSAVCLLARPITGWLADNGSRRATFMCSCFVYVSSMIMMLISPFFSLFVGMRLIMGLGIGSATTVVTACSYDEIPPSKMDKGVGYISLFSSLITAATPALSIGAYNKSGPQTLVIWSVIAMAVGIGLSFFVTFRKPAASKKRSIKNAFSPKNLFDVRCLKPAIPMALSVNLGLGVRTFVTLYGRSLGFANPGWFSTISAVGLIFVRLILDRVKTDEPFPRKRIHLAYGIYVVFIFCLGFCKNLAMFYTAAILWSVAYGILLPSFTSMMIRSVPADRRGAAASMTGICGDIGMILGSTVGGLISDAMGYGAMYLFMLIPVAFCFIYYRIFLDRKIVPWQSQQDK